MRVYILRFYNDALLQGAFDRVLGSPHVASCMVESTEARIRFLAPAAAADALVEDIYLEGGLVWCSRHDVASGMEHALTTPDVPSAP